VLYRQKIVLLTDSLSRNPKDKKALSARANAYLKLQDLKHAAQDCDQALALDPKLFDAAVVAYGLVDAYNGDMQEENALHFLNLTITAIPNEPRLYVERGQLLHGIGRDKEALVDQNKAVQIDPENSKAYYARAEVRITMGDLRGAACDFGIGAKYDKQPIHCYLAQAKCFDELKDYKAAIKTIGKILPLPNVYLPDLLQARLLRAKAFIKIGEYDNALKDLDVIISTPISKTMKFENNGQLSQKSLALQTRVELYTTLKKTDLAIKDYGKLIALDQEWGQMTPKWYEERAKLYRQTSKPELALRDELLARNMTQKKQ